VVQPDTLIKWHRQGWRLWVLLPACIEMNAPARNAKTNANPFINEMSLL
jgi:hypothetical protein